MAQDIDFPEPPKNSSALDLKLLQKSVFKFRHLWLKSPLTNNQNHFFLYVITNFNLQDCLWA